MGQSRTKRSTDRGVETVPRSAAVGIDAWAWSFWGVMLSGVQLSGSQSLVRTEIFGSAHSPFVLGAVSVCEPAVLGTRCDTAAAKQPPDLLA